MNTNTVKTHHKRTCTAPFQQKPISHVRRNKCACGFVLIRFVPLLRSTHLCCSGRRLTRQQLSSLADQRRRVRAVRRYDGLGGPNAHGKRQSLPALNFRTSQEQSQQQQFHE